MKGDSVTSPEYGLLREERNIYGGRPTGRPIDRRGWRNRARNKGAQRRLSRGEFESFLGRAPISEGATTGGKESPRASIPPPRERERETALGRRPEVTTRFRPRQAALPASFAPTRLRLVPRRCRLKIERKRGYRDRLGGKAVAPLRNETGSSSFCCKMCVSMACVSLVACVTRMFGRVREDARSRYNCK